MKHELKCWPAVFQAMLDGTKGFEYRKNDRDFKCGDTLYQREWNPETQEYTGREMHQGPIPYIVYGGRFGIPDGYCIMQTQSLASKTAEVEALNEKVGRMQDIVDAAKRVDKSLGVNMTTADHELRKALKALSAQSKEGA